MVAFTDRLHGEQARQVDDFVVRRGDGVPAYNLAVVVDDHHQRIAEVVRGDDLLAGTARQAWLCDRLRLPRPSWAHVPVVLGPDGERLAKRHGAVSLRQLEAAGVGPGALLGMMAASLDLADAGERADLATLLRRFDPGALPTTPWTFVSPA